MATNDKAVKGEKNRKTTDEIIPGKEKAKDRREQSVPPNQSDPDASDQKSNQDEPKAEKQNRPKNDNKDKGDDKPKKKD
jgi:hypothetical protein